MYTIINQRKILIILLFFLVASIGLSSGISFYLEEDDEVMKLVRISYSDNHIMLVQNLHLEIVGMNPDEWIDVLVVESELDQLEQRNIDYVIEIDDVDELFNEMRGSYRTFPEMEQALQDIADTYPNITSLYSIGTSYEGRDIWCLEISENPGVDESKPGVFFVGLHHAREWPTIEICMYIAENLTSNYGVDLEITDIIDNRRIWIVPCQNPDGYVYSHDQGNNMWRKNRRYFPNSGTYGVDLNRNYGGSSNGDAWGSWGSVGPGSISNNPSSDTYCGPWSMSENCTQAIKNMFIEHDICATISWHTYSELVLWPWGYSEYETTPDNTYMSQVGIDIASQITKQSGSGTYTPMQSSGLYPTTGDTTDWVYGYSHYVKGKTCFAYTIEACTSFFPPEAYLDQICSENYDGAFYLLQEAANIDMVVPRVISPIIDQLPEPTNEDYTISWTEQNPMANPDYFQLDELRNFSKMTDDAENGTSLWDCDGFSLSASRAYSGSYSFKSRYANSDVSSMVSTFPLPIESGMNLSFWCWYDIENNYDMAFVEVSTNARSFELLDIFNGYSNGWKYKEYSLEPWVGESIFIRFRHTTDSNTLKEGFYVDDIYPVPNFTTVNTLSSTIPTTSYEIIGNDEGVYYYQVKGYNNEYEWGDYSSLKRVNVTYDELSIEITNISATPRVQETPGWVNISCSLLPLNDVTTIILNVTKPDNTYVNQSMNHVEGSDIFYFNMSYSLNGTYAYYIWVTSDDEQKKSFIFHFHIGSGFIDIAFLPGWNLITIPVETNWTSLDIIANISGCVMISWFDAVDQTFKTSTGSGYVFPIEPGLGYFVYVTTESIYSVVGLPILNVSIPLELDWNMIGWYHEYDTDSTSVMSTISGCLMLSWFDAVNQTYKTSTGPGYVFDITRGMGLFAYVNESSIWHGEG